MNGTSVKGFASLTVYGSYSREHTPTLQDRVRPVQPEFQPNRERDQSLPKPYQLARVVAEKAALISEADLDNYISAVRRRKPNMTDADLVAALEYDYMRTLLVTGATAGIVAAKPDIGAAAGMSSAVLDASAYGIATAKYMLAAARVHAVDVRDTGRLQELVLTAVGGQGATGVTGKMAARFSGHYGRRIVKAIPVDAIDKANSKLAPRVITKYGNKQGIIVLGVLVPIGIGATVSAFAHLAMARATIGITRRALGPLPDGSILSVQVEAIQVEPVQMAEDSGELAPCEDTPLGTSGDVAALDQSDEPDDKQSD